MKPIAFVLLLACGARPLEVDVSGKARLFVPLGVGLRTNFDDKLLPFGSDLEIENAFSTRTGELVKRFGGAALGSGLLGTADTLPQSWRLATLGNALVSLSPSSVDHPINVWSEFASQWATDAGAGTAFQTSRRGAISAARDRLAAIGRGADFATGGGFYFVTYWAPIAGGGITIYQTGEDATTGQKIFERTVTSTVAAPRVLGVSFVNGYAVFVHDSDAAASDIVFDYWQLSNLDPGASTTVFPTTTGLVSASMGDVSVKNATTVQVAYVNNGGIVLGVDFVPSTATTTGWTLNDAAAATVPDDLALSWMQDLSASGKNALITASAAQGVRVQWDIPAAGATRQAVSTYTMDAAPATPMGNVTGHTRTAAATGEFTVLYDNTNGQNSLVSTGTRTGGVIAASVLYRGVRIQSKTWQNGIDYYVLAMRPSDLQGTRYVLKVPFSGQPAPLAIVAVNGASSGFIDQRSSVASPSTGVYVTGITVSTRLPGNPSGYLSDDLGVDLVTIKHLATLDTTTGRPYEANNSLYVPGGNIAVFDGTTFAEMGFTYYPEQPTLTPNAGGANTYWYVLVYRYYDTDGNVYRSNTSLKLSTGTAAVIGGGGSVTVACPTLRITGRGGVFIEVYRGALGDSTLFQKIGTVANSTTANTVNFVDAVTDATLASGAFLYTNGTAGNRRLGNDTIPGASFVLPAKNRLFFVSLDNQQEVWFSDLRKDGQGWMFSEERIVTIADAHGAITGLAAMDDKIVVFKRDAIYVFNGEGPDDNGNGAFGEPQMVAVGIGTANAMSILAVKDGVFFESTAQPPGLQMLNRALQIARDGNGVLIGAAVQRYTETITAAVLVDDQAQARFYTASGRTLVYDLVDGLWTTFTDQPAYAAAFWGGSSAAYSGPIGPTVRTEDTTGATYTEAGQQYGWKITSPYIADAKRAFERIHQLQGVGETAGDHLLFIELYDRAVSDTVARVTKSVSLTVASRPRWDWQLIPRIQRFSALKIILSETGSTAGARVSGVALTVSAKRGMARQATEKRIP